MKTLKQYEEEGWKYEYEPAFGCYALFRPDGRVVWKDYDFTAPEGHILKVIGMYNNNVIGLV